MQWKSVVGWILLGLGALGSISALVHLKASSYSAGNLTAGVLFVLLGVWLIRTGRRELGR